MKFVKIAAMLLAGGGMLFSSCSDSNSEGGVTTPSLGAQNEIRAELIRVGESSSRSHNVYMYEVRWDEGDQIYVKDAAGEHAKFTLVEGENTTEGVFRQNSDENAPLVSPIAAYSPAALGETMTWPSALTEGDAMPMYSTKDTPINADEALKFKSLGSVVNLVFNTPTKGATLRSVVLSADQPLSGAFTVDAEGKAVLAAGADGTLALDFGTEGRALTSPAAYSFYLCAPAGDYTNLTATFNPLVHKPYVCNLGAQTLHHNTVEKYTVAGEFSAYTVKFNTRGYAAKGSGPAEQQIIYNGLIKKPADPSPSKAGITFAGWYKDEARTEPWDFDNDRVTGDITLYARWLKRAETDPTWIRGRTILEMGWDDEEIHTYTYEDLRIDFGGCSKNVWEDERGHVCLDAQCGINFSYLDESIKVTRVLIVSNYYDSICTSDWSWYTDGPEATWSDSNGAQSVCFLGSIEGLSSITVTGCKMIDL